MRRHARGKLRGCARHLAQGHDGLDADHAGKWAGLRGRYRLGAEPYDAHNNIIAGAASAQAARPRWAPGFLAAYNAGPARWEYYLATGRPLPMETQAYVARLTPIVGGSAPDSGVPLASIVRSWTKSSQFVARSIGSLIGGRSAQKEQS